MYKKYLVVASKSDPAGENIVANLEQFMRNPEKTEFWEQPNFDIYITDEKVIYDENIDKFKIDEYDFIIFASMHQSEKGEPSLTVHAPGNWFEAKFGGEGKKVCYSSALFFKHIFETLNCVSKKYDLDKKYQITMEATHHGPLMVKPCLFIEIGSKDLEWEDRRAGFVIAKTISDAIETFKPSKYREIAIGIGGPHYCPNFNKIQEKSNIALSHIIPSYISPITEQMIKEAIEKTEEELDFAVIDWKAFNSEERQKIIDILNKNYISWKKTSDVSS